MKRVAGVLFGAALGLGFVVACSSSDDASAGQVIAGACGTIANRCHPFEGKTDLAHTCHETGHDSTDDKCSPIYDKCLAECPETDAALPFQIVDGQAVFDTGSPADAGDAAADANPDLCAPYCECVATTCNTQEGYPYGDAGVAEQKATCLSTCRASLTAEQITCWTDHCGAAQKLSEVNRSHECRHALGYEELDECN